MQQDEGGRSSPPSKPRAFYRRKWFFRLLAMTLVPALVLVAFELLLVAIGFGRSKTFFVPCRIEGEQVYVENIDFGCRFFPNGMERVPLPISIAAEKAPNEYRIFVLGESAALGFPDSSSSFARILAVMLRERYPATRFTITNTAMTAINSHVILPIARDCATLQPDLYIVYMGNNEVVGPYGAADVLGSHSSQIGLTRASIWLKSRRTGELLSRLAAYAQPSNTVPRSWEGMALFENSKFRADDQRLSVVYSSFFQNLTDIVAVGQNAGAKMFVCTVGTNVKDSPPFGSLHSAELSTTQADDWNRLYEEGIRLETQADFLGAIERYQAAAQLDAAWAELHFRLARCLLAVQRETEAREHFRQARDRDVLRFRADTRINELIRSLAGGKSDDGVYLLDMEQALNAASAHELAGRDLFHEHVHLNFHGNYLIARKLFEQIDKLLADGPRGAPGALPTSEAQCQDQLLYNDWKHLTELTTLAVLYKQPPFVDQLGSEERSRLNQLEIDELQERLRAGGLAEAAAQYRRALAQDPRDVLLRQDFVVLLMTTVELDEAAEQLLELQRQLPYYPVPHVLLGQVLLAKGEHFGALRECDEALRLRPGWPQALQLRSEIHAALGRSP